VIGDGFKAMWQPGEDVLAQALAFGKDFAGKA